MSGDGRSKPRGPQMPRRDYKAERLRDREQARHDQFQSLPGPQRRGIELLRIMGEQYRPQGRRDRIKELVSDPTIHPNTLAAALEHFKGEWVSYGYPEDLFPVERKFVLEVLDLLRKNPSLPKDEVGGTEKRYFYVHSCPSAQCGEDILALQENAHDVERETFVRYTDDEDRRSLEAALGYDRHFPISRDWMVRYKKGIYRGIPAYYLLHSRIEHIFTLDGKLGPSLADAEVGRKAKPPSPLSHLTASVPDPVLEALRRRAQAKDEPLSRYAGRFLERAAKRLERPQGEPTKKRSYCDPAWPACSYAIEGASCSLEAPLYVAARGGHLGVQRIPARYCAIEIEDLLTSHKPISGFGLQEGYPQEAQERDYRLPVEQAKVRQIAEHYEPDLIFNTAPGALDGLPVVTEGRLVLGGNGRTMATALVYAGEGNITPEQLRAYVIAKASLFGLTKAKLQKLKRPMIVRTIRTEQDAKTLAEWSRTLNASLSMQLDATRLAVSRARFVDKKALDELADMGDEETLAQFLSSPRSRGFVDALRSSNILDARSAAQFLEGGLLNQAGRDMVQDLLLAVLLPDASTITALGPQVVATLARSAPYLIRTGELGDYNLAPPFRKAVRDYLSLRNAPVKSVDEFLRQGGLFGTSAISQGDPLALILLQALYELAASPVKLAKMMRFYLREALSPGRGQSALFAAAAMTPLQALRNAAAEVSLKIPQSAVGALRQRRFV